MSVSAHNLAQVAQLASDRELQEALRNDKTMRVAPDADVNPAPVPVSPFDKHASRDDVRAFYGATHRNYPGVGVLSDQEAIDYRARMFQKAAVDRDIEAHNRAVATRRALKKAKKAK